MCALARASPLGPDGEPGRTHPEKFIWFDLATDDPEGAPAFYGWVFGWQFQAVANAPISYTLIEHDGTKVGGMFPPFAAGRCARGLALARADVGPGCCKGGPVRSTERQESAPPVMCSYRRGHGGHGAGLLAVEFFPQQVVATVTSLT